MFMVQGIEGNRVSLSFFFEDKKNILKNAIKMANYSGIEEVMVKEIFINENDEDELRIILMAKAAYFKK